MGHVVACQCGWTLISPMGADDVYAHLVVHVREHHKGFKASESEMRNEIRTI